MSPDLLLKLLPNEEAPSGGVVRSVVDGRTVVSFKPTGFGRFLTIPFLGVWLCGWAAGEAAVVLVLASLLGVRFAPGLLHGLHFANVHAPSLGGIGVALFLSLWLALWTVAGVGALRALLDLVWATDAIAFDGDRVVISRQRGPYRWSREFPRAAIRGFGLDIRRASLVLRLEARDVALTTYGSRRERRELRDELRAALGVAENPASDVPDAPPKGWECEPGMEGGWRLRRPARTQRIVAVSLWSLVAALLMCAAFLVRPANPPTAGGPAAPLILLAVFTFLAAAAGAWVTWAREEWLIRPGHIEHRIAFAGRSRVVTFATPTVAIERKVDSDGDILFALAVREGERRQQVESSMNDLRPTLPLGRWLAARVGVTLQLPAELRTDEAA